MKLRTGESCSSDFLVTAHHYGLEYVGAGIFEKQHPGVDSPGERFASQYRAPCVGALRIPEIPIPEALDPRIYKPDIGTHTSPSGTADQWRELMEWEGRSDADTVLRYLSAYNAFIREPTGAHLIAATENPSTGTDSYFLGMMYLKEVCRLGAEADAQPGSLQRDMFDLLGLLHVTFFTHFTARAAGECRLQPCDLRLCAALAHTFAASHGAGKTTAEGECLPAPPHL